MTRHLCSPIITKTAADFRVSLTCRPPLIVGLRTDVSVVSMLRVRAEDQVTSLYGALGNYLTSNGLSLGDVRRVVLTGVGASYVDGDVFGLPTCRVDEFQASGTGALALSGQTSGVVVTTLPPRWTPT